MKTYKPTIGLEIHAELRTETKMFCDSKNDANESKPNVNICPVCMAHPGTLPVINRQAVMHVLRVGVALGGKLADYTEFDRKNYFYPDLPKGYQLSQFEFPLVSGGVLNGVQITRVHLEEDTASSLHGESNASGDSEEVTLVDYNRAGVPLMELVTEPVLHSAEDAGNFGRELQLLLRTLHASYADMEKGNMRLEANISISDTDELGTKVEVKNINSFRAMERAIEFEIKRQSNLLDRGMKVDQETRGWDENRQETFSQRVKEGSADYRYFPDPDLPSLKLSELGLTADSIRDTLPELPSEKRARYNALGINPQDVELYVKDRTYGGFFEAVGEVLGKDPAQLKLASNYIANDLVSLSRDVESRDVESRDAQEMDKISISAIYFAKIIKMLSSKKISSRSAKELLQDCLDGVSDPDAVAKEKGLLQEANNAQLGATILKVIADNPVVVADFKAGKGPALEYLVGQCMKALRGAADAALLREELKKLIT